ncbi:MAG: glycosyltransferase [Spongiibacteraceae bacterium]
MTMPPLAGHINPALAVAAQLQSRGHAIAWALHGALMLNGSMASERLPSSSTLLSLPIDSLSLVDSPRDVRGLESVRFFYEDFFLPLAHGSLFPLEKIVREFNPDLIVCDQQMLAGAFVARKLDIPWLTSVTTTASLIKMSPQHDEWVAEKFRELEAIYPLPQSVERPDLSPYGVLVFSSKQLLGEDAECFDAPYHFVGPAYGTRATHDDFPWKKLKADKQKLLISLGTVSRDRSTRFYEVMMTALADMDIQVIMVAPETLALNAPDNFIVLPRVPQLQLLPYMNAVVCHAGHNTVCETLAHGLPLIVAPIRDDQPVIARQVIDAGAGLFMRFGKVTAATARSTVEQLLANKNLKQNAERLARSFEGLGGAERAAAIIESQLCGGRSYGKDSYGKHSYGQHSSENSGYGDRATESVADPIGNRGNHRVFCG